MGKTIIEKILTDHSDRDAVPGALLDIEIDARVARDFGGANVVQNLTVNGLPIADPAKTYFTFDCNPGGSDQKYAANQHACRLFARQNNIQVCDIDAGIGTHQAIEKGFVAPGGTFVSTDSHANIMGAIGAFGQGMGDQDIAHAFAYGTVWFKVPKSMKVTLVGQPGPLATPKDVTLAVNKHFGANGLLGYAAEFYGDYIDGLDLPGRITMASMCTEMGGIIMLFPPNREVIEFCSAASGRQVPAVYADEDAHYDAEVTIDISGVQPMIARPGHPDDVVPVSEVAGVKIDSVFIGSCTNGRSEDILAAAEILNGRHVAPGVVLKIVPSTNENWNWLLANGVIKSLKEAGALIGNAGCGGCAAGQIGQNGPGEVTVSTGNRNFPGKQGKGNVYLASPQTAAASALAGVLTTVDKIPAEPARFEPEPVATDAAAGSSVSKGAAEAGPKPTTVKGRAWVIDQDNIDTDMIYHNRYLTITNIDEMGQYALDNLAGWEDFARKAQPGDIIITGKNFGCGSSRQQAVDCFKALGIAALVAESFGAIYERNAINAGFPILNADAVHSGIENGEEIEVDFTTGTIRRPNGQTIQGEPFADAQMSIYQRGGLLSGGKV